MSTVENAVFFEKYVAMFYSLRGHEQDIFFFFRAERSELVSISKRGWRPVMQLRNRKDRCNYGQVNEQEK